MRFGIVQPILVLVFMLILSIIILIVKAKFDFKLENQDKWLKGSIIIIIFTLVSSLINYTNEWKILFKHLQVFTLATLFSAIAAIGVIIQISKSPYVFTTVNLLSNSKKIGVQITENSETKLTLFVKNCSKVTAKNIYVKGKFPSEVEILNIETPMWNKIEGNRFDVKFDTNSYNHLHPFSHTSFDIKIKSGKINSYKSFIIYTLAKNMQMIQQSFAIKTKKFNSEGMLVIEDMDKKENKNILNLSFQSIREKYFSLQKIFTVMILILGISSWEEPLSKLFVNIISIFENLV